VTNEKKHVTLSKKFLQKKKPWSGKFFTKEKKDIRQKKTNTNKGKIHCRLIPSLKKLNKEIHYG